MRIPNWTDRQLASFSNQLSRLLSVGFGLVDALNAIERHSARKLKTSIHMLLRQLQQGSSLSISLEKIRFPPFYVFLMTSAEHHGRNAETLELLSRYYAQRAARRNKHRKALLYPCFVLCACGVSFLFIVYGLLPQLSSLYDSFTLELPWYSVQLLRLSSWNGWTVAMLSLVSFLLFFFYFMIKHRLRSETLLLRIPFVSLFFKTRLTAVTLKQMGYLLDSGARATLICDLFSKHGHWEVVSHSFDQVKRDLFDGVSLSQAFKRVPFLHPLAVEAIYVFEQSGTLATGMTQLADQFEAEYDRQLEWLAKTVETGAVAIAGLFVLLMILALFIPMFHFIEYV